jgi:hypothetical protein
MPLANGSSVTDAVQTVAIVIAVIISVVVFFITWYQQNKAGKIGGSADLKDQWFSIYDSLQVAPTAIAMFGLKYEQGESELAEHEILELIVFWKIHNYFQHLTRLQNDKPPTRADGPTLFDAMESAMGKRFWRLCGHTYPEWWQSVINVQLGFGNRV